MQLNNQETRILLAIEASQKDKNPRIQKAVKLFNIMCTTTQRRMDGSTPRIESQANYHHITQIDEQVIIQHIFDMDDRGFPLKL